MHPRRAPFLLAAASLATAVHAGTWIDFGTLGGNFSEAFGVSADGSVVVGSSFTGFAYHAFRWTSAGGMIDLGTLGGNWSQAKGVSADGSVVVGTSKTASSLFHGFRWTSTGGMIDLGTLGGDFSQVEGVSADGSVVVGTSKTASTLDHAFRWTSAGGMIDLGTLVAPGTLGGNWSSAFGVSADGSVVVGSSFTGSANHAFRWTSAGGMTDLGTLGGDSEALGVSADGSVVVGMSDTGSKLHAYRWTSSGGMTDLGHLGGDSSIAYGVSADGSVVVGASATASGPQHAFRWMSAGGMTDLGTLGGNWSSAFGVSADGSVVVGASATASGENHAFIYHERAMLDATDWLGSVSGLHTTLSTALELPRLFMEGAHHRPLAELGQGRSYWVTGDVASSSRSRDLLTRSGEAGVTFLPLPNLLVGVGAGYGQQSQDLINAGRASLRGQYAVAVADLIQPDGGVFSLLLSLGDWKYEADRGYVTGSGVDYSHGVTNVTTRSARVRYDSPVLYKVYGSDLKAYMSYSMSKAQSDAFAETGGSYAGSFGAMEQTAKEGRLGVAVSRVIGDKTTARLSAECIRRYDHGQSALTAIDITSTVAASVATADPVRDQARFGLDIDHKLDAQTTLSFTVHAAGVGESPDVSGAISLRHSF